MPGTGGSDEHSLISGYSARNIFFMPEALSADGDELVLIAGYSRFDCSFMFTNLGIDVPLTGNAGGHQ